jgi:hypothetical protein
MAARRAEALVVTADAYLYAQRRGSRRWRCATACPRCSRSRLRRRGGLMSYGVDPAPAIRQAAVFVDKIFKGATPATCRSSSRRGSRW